MGSIPVGSTKKRDRVVSFLGTPDGNSVPARFIAQGAQVCAKSANLTGEIKAPGTICSLCENLSLENAFRRTRDPGGLTAQNANRTDKVSLRFL